MMVSVEIDTRGLRCPLPVLRARKALDGLASGDVLRLWADDPIAVIDIPHFCQEAGHEVIAVEETADAQIYLIRRG
ncbi:sulfurtransferase TusA family protein [Rhodovulum euryhalinum]|uniref:tRNA 2-thiouridine synthesizing protein A n=1 Tax=Rhodovulum euryhalinum TaxID=35805 RepID=A0A4R2KCI5_9RHOB|nr:sulfurtransferase TusA family protein [Rhodovulum euryhalinum]TCO70604.1 tRNA 2-thiouridine synthesizing protein A [Rhodovulum euryhalinum]